MTDDLRGIVSGALVIDRDTQIHGIVNGDVKVQAGCTVVVNGIVNGDVILDFDADAAITGIVNGRIVRR